MYELSKKKVSSRNFFSEMEVFLVKKGVFLVKKRPHMLYMKFQTVKTGNNRENKVDD